LLAALLVAGGGLFLLIGDDDPAPNDPTPKVRIENEIDVVRFTVDSASVGRRREIGLVPSKGAALRPLLVLLHGQGTSPEWLMSDELLAALKAQGRKAPAVVLLDGSNDSYWHDRADGKWGKYVVKEAIPAAAERLGADPKRVAIGGISMGGFGALDLARVYPNRFCAVGAHSPALWRTFDETFDAAFDDEADFEEHDLFQKIEEGFRYPEPVRIDVGTEDPFFEADSDFADLLEETGADVGFHDAPGGHDIDYWWPRMPAYLSYYAGALASCEGPG
jgi:S-formylglutathione hydrolase FrmB